jgi:hypothetical protein
MLIIVPEDSMTEKIIYPLKPLPVANYRSALARALEWLGDRYLLAKPINSAHRLGVDRDHR